MLTLALPSISNGEYVVIKNAQATLEGLNPLVVADFSHTFNIDLNNEAKSLIEFLNGVEIKKSGPVLHSLIWPKHFDLRNRSIQNLSRYAQRLDYISLLWTSFHHIKALCKSDLFSKFTSDEKGLVRNIVANEKNINIIKELLTIKGDISVSLDEALEDLQKKIFDVCEIEARYAEAEPDELYKQLKHNVKILGKFKVSAFVDNKELRNQFIDMLDFVQAFLLEAKRKGLQEAIVSAIWPEFLVGEQRNYIGVCKFVAWWSYVLQLDNATKDLSVWDDANFSRFLDEAKKEQLASLKMTLSKLLEVATVENAKITHENWHALDSFIQEVAAFDFIKQKAAEAIRMAENQRIANEQARLLIKLSERVEILKFNDEAKRELALEIGFVENFLKQAGEMGLDVAIKATVWPDFLSRNNKDLNGLYAHIDFIAFYTHLNLCKKRLEELQQCKAHLSENQLAMMDNNKNILDQLVSVTRLSNFTELGWTKLNNAFNSLNELSPKAHLFHRLQELKNGLQAFLAESKNTMPDKVKASIAEVLNLVDCSIKKAFSDNLQELEKVADNVSVFVDAIRQQLANKKLSEEAAAPNSLAIKTKEANAKLVAAAVLNESINLVRTKLVTDVYSKVSKKAEIDEVLARALLIAEQSPSYGVARMKALNEFFKTVRDNNSYLWGYVDGAKWLKLEKLSKQLLKAADPQLKELGNAIGQNTSRYIRDANNESIDINKLSEKKLVLARELNKVAVAYLVNPATSPSLSAEEAVARALMLKMRVTKEQRQAALSKYFDAVRAKFTEWSFWPFCKRLSQKWREFESRLVALGDAELLFDAKISVVNITPSAKTPQSKGVVGPGNGIKAPAVKAGPVLDVVSTTPNAARPSLCLGQAALRRGSVASVSSNRSAQPPI